jgi:hypothetical protein
MRGDRVFWLGPIVLGLGVAGLAAEPAAKPRYRIEYATYLGGAEFDQAREIIVDPDGSVLVGAQTNSSDMPTTPGAFRRKYAGDDPALGHGGIYGGDCYLVRLSPDGSRILSATYFGGSKQERNVYGMGLDRKHNVVIASATRSPDLPTTPTAFQRKYGGGPSDWMVAKLSGDLTRLIWCTYVGGRGDDFPRGGLAVDEHDNVYVVGVTNSPDFPTTAGAFQEKFQGTHNAAVVKLKADGSALLSSTLLGRGETDTIMGVRVDAAANLYVAGHIRTADLPVTPGAPQAKHAGQSDCFFAKFSSDASRLLYATYLGGVQNEFAEHRLWLGADGSVLLAGVTSSPDFPTTPGAFQRKLKGRNDGFLTKLSPDGKRFEFSTLLGGSGGEFFLMPTPDAEGNIFVVGTTQSPDFPVTPDALQGRFAGPAETEGGEGDGVLAVLSPDGSRVVYATYLGGGGGDLIRSIALGPQGEVYLVGNTSSPDFPVTPQAVQKTLRGKADAFIVKLVPTK